jgi:hypothetical protein
LFSRDDWETTYFGTKQGMVCFQKTERIAKPKSANPMISIPLSTRIRVPLEKKAKQKHLLLFLPSLKC